MVQNKLEILLVEDNPIFVKLLEHSFKEFFHLAYEFHYLVDGESAIRYLNSLTRKNSTDQKKLPDFILLDLNLPGKKGIEVLSEIRSSTFFKKMPIYILSSSDDKEEMALCKKIGAEHFFVKPISYDGMEQLLGELEELAKRLISKV